MLPIVSAGEEISSRRLTIIVKVIYKDLVQKKQFLKITSPIMAITSPVKLQTKEMMLAVAVDKISEDILLAVVSGW
jgi:hypothetical protein